MTSILERDILDYIGYKIVVDECADLVMCKTPFKSARLRGLLVRKLIDNYRSIA